MINFKFCPFCRSFNTIKYNQDGFAPRVLHEIMPKVNFDALIVTPYFICEDCGLIFQNPRMSDEELDKFYKQGFYRKTLNLTDRQIEDDEIFRAKKDAKIIKNNTNQIESHLDIGSGGGFLLKEIDAQIKVGVEIDKARIKQDMEIYEDINYLPQRTFNLITAIHVLEHLADPFGYLKKIKNFMDKNSYLIIEVPTWKSPGGPLRLAHIYHFESDTLRLICKEIGLDIIHTEFTPHLFLICRLSTVD